MLWTYVDTKSGFSNLNLPMYNLHKLIHHIPIWVGQRLWLQREDYVSGEGGSESNEGDHCHGGETQELAEDASWSE